jgi:hypothetical protein
MIIMFGPSISAPNAPNETTTIAAIPLPKHSDGSRMMIPATGSDARCSLRSSRGREIVVGFPQFWRRSPKATAKTARDIIGESQQLVRGDALGFKSSTAGAAGPRNPLVLASSLTQNSTLVSKLPEQVCNGRGAAGSAYGSVRRLRMSETTRCGGPRDLLTINEPLKKIAA